MNGKFIPIMQHNIQTSPLYCTSISHTWCLIIYNIHSSVISYFVFYIDGYGGWDSEGCIREINSNSEVTCVCNHLTHFALITQVIIS